MLIFFSNNLPAGTLSSVLKMYFFAKIFCVKILFCKHYFSPLNTFMIKGKDPNPDPYLWLIDPDIGGPETCGSCGSGFPTLVSSVFNKKQKHGRLARKTTKTK